jgi:hypothetical protein
VNKNWKLEPVQQVSIQIYRMNGTTNLLCFLQNAVFVQATLPEAKHDLPELFCIKQKILNCQKTMSKTETYHRETTCNQKEILVEVSWPFSYKKYWYFVVLEEDKILR